MCHVNLSRMYILLVFDGIFYIYHLIQPANNVVQVIYILLLSCVKIHNYNSDLFIFSVLSCPYFNIYFFIFIFEEYMFLKIKANCSKS